MPAHRRDSSIECACVRDEEEATWIRPCSGIGAKQAGVKIAITTDAHSTREFGLVRYGLDQARRAGLSKDDVLNCMPCAELCRLMQR